MKLTTRIRYLLEQGGPIELIKGVCRFVYWQAGLRTARYSVSYRLYGSPVVCKHEGIHAKFEAGSRKEYSRVRTLHGEQTVVGDLIRTLDHDDIFYDIGANVGTYACFAGQIVYNGLVIAFEPHPANVDRLRVNASLNDIDINVQPVALSNETASTELAVSGEEDNAGVGTHSLATEDQEKTMEIETVEADYLIENGKIPSPTVIKIDVEGAEQRVLEGLSSILENEQCHTVYCEVHPDRLSAFGGSAEQVETLLREAGYSIEVLEERSPEYFLKAVRRD